MKNKAKTKLISLLIAFLISVFFASIISFCLVKIFSRQPQEILNITVNEVINTILTEKEGLEIFILSIFAFLLFIKDRNVLFIEKVKLLKRIPFIKFNKRKVEDIFFIKEDMHSLTVGATRSGKTRCLVLESIGNTALAGENMIISDPKR